MIHLEQRDVASPRGLSIRKCVEPGAEHHVLSHAALDRIGELVFRVAIACDDVRAQGRYAGLGESGGAGPESLERRSVHETDDDRVIEDLRLPIDQLMRRAQRGDADSRGASLALAHARR